MTTGEQGENGRVSLALVMHRLGEMDKKLDRIEQNQCKADDRITAVERSQAVTEERLHTQAEEVKALKSRDLLGTVGATLLGLGAALLGLFK